MEVEAWKRICLGRIGENNSVLEVAKMNISGLAKIKSLIKSNIVCIWKNRNSHLVLVVV